MDKKLNYNQFEFPNVRTKILWNGYNSNYCDTNGYKVKYPHVLLRLDQIKGFKYNKSNYCIR